MLPTTQADRRYRTKIEVLRDFLEAVRRTPRKTRVIGLANLNPVSFEKYLALSVALGLVDSASGGYQLTRRADVALESIQRFLDRSSALGTSLQDLHGAFRLAPVDGPGGDDAHRLISRLAWNTIILSQWAPTSPATDSSGSRATMPYLSPDVAAWLDREAEGEGPPTVRTVHPRVDPANAAPAVAARERRAFRDRRKE
jgi:predicted transcriptional regulator